MHVLKKTCIFSNRRHQLLSKERANDFVKRNGKNAIRILIENLSGTKTSIASVCIKVSYERGENNPGLIAPRVRDFILLVDAKDNGMQWRIRMLLI